MELEFDREVMQGYQIIASGTVCQEETLETIVPDACPDIARIVGVKGQAALNGRQAREGLAEVTGSVRAVVLYQPEEGEGLCRMEAALPFTAQLEASGLTERGKLEGRVCLRDLQAKVLNPRKILLRADLAVEITAFQPAETVCCQQVLEPEQHGVQQQIIQGETYQLFAVQEKPFTLSEQVRMSGGQGESLRLLALQAQPVCGESKLIGSKLILKGTLELQFLAQEPGGGLCASSEVLPFSQILEVPGAGEGSQCQLCPQLTQISWQTASEDGRTLDLTADILVQAQVWQRRSFPMLQDLYSTAWETQVSRETLSLWRLLDQGERMQNLRELLETASLVRTVADSWIELGPVRESREGGTLVLTGEIKVSVLCLDEDQRPQVVEKPLTVACRLEAHEGAVCRCRMFCPGEVFAAPAAGGVEVRCAVQFQFLLLQENRCTVVCAAQLGEERTREEGEQPSVVLRLAAPGEGLWELAKTYGTTISQILQANDLEEDSLPQGQMLLIPSLR